MHLELRLQRQPHLEEFVAPYRASAGDAAISIHRTSRGAVDSGLEFGPELYASSGASAFAGRDRAATDTGLRPSLPGNAKEARTFRALIVTVVRPQWCGMCKATPNGPQSTPECHQCVYSSCPTRLAARCPPVHSDRPNSTGLTEGPLSRRRTRGIFRNGTVPSVGVKLPKVPSVSICSVIEASSKQSQKAAGGQLSGSAPTCKLTEPSSGEEVFTPPLSWSPAAGALTAIGSMQVKILPMPGSLDTRIAPPCAPTIPAAAESPSPRPMNFVVKNGSKIRGLIASSIPHPVSVTRRKTYSPGGEEEGSAGPAPAVSVLMVSDPVQMVTIPDPSPMASSALRYRLPISWRSLIAVALHRRK